MGRVTTKHPTSSVFVFRQMPAGWRLGLIRHPRFGRMMIPGGHVEQEESQAEAALREVAEETGLAVRLVSPPAPPLPGGYQPQRVAQPWWIVEYSVPRDNHLAVPHVHIDHLYVALAQGEQAVGEPAHPFGWYAAADLRRLDMFDDARTLALALLSGLSALAAGADGAADPVLSAALLARLGGLSRLGFPGPQCCQGPGSPVHSARTASMVSASDAGLSGLYRSTRAKRSATPPGYLGLACTPSNATSTTSSGRTRRTP
jgi:8-oxo-dGTP pyrophosphatase MutT (NUDIX family)